ncbi:MAG: DUF692 family protein [Planctomycetes bacterium]|nr:DUF692 family protein [Planctomycetota bacterium]
MSERSFQERITEVPRLGIGISTEHGAGLAGLDLEALHLRRPDLVQFLEIGADLERGFDADATRWIASGRKTTYHFLDVNLEEPEDIEPAWIAATAALAREAGAAWLCGDAGLWHVGPRDRGHGVLMPPILCEESIAKMATAVRRLRRESGFEVLPENPPAQVHLGDLTVPEYFGTLARVADCGLLLDVAHLAITQIAGGGDLFQGLENFPMDRVVEMHVAGGALFDAEGLRLVDDDHGVEIQDETWALFRHVLARATNLKAIVLEAERNRIDEVIPLFERLHDAWGSLNS